MRTIIALMLAMAVHAADIIPLDDCPLLLRGTWYALAYSTDGGETIEKASDVIGTMSEQRWIGCDGVPVKGMWMCSLGETGEPWIAWRRAYLDGNGGRTWFLTQPEEWLGLYLLQVMDDDDAEVIRIVIRIVFRVDQ